MEIQVLDSVIALVVVILLLSLIVQAIQGALKKLFKIKSRNLEISLIDLFENALDMGKQGNPTMMTRAVENSPLLELVKNSPQVVKNSPLVARLRSSNSPAAPAAAPVASPPATSSARTLLDEVRKEFEDIGRVAQSGRWALDSLAKEDLLKVMARIAPGTLLPKLLTHLGDACRQVIMLETSLKTVVQSMKAAGVSGEASARFAALRQALAPLINDVRAIYDGQSHTLSTNLIIGDILRLREIKLEDILAALAETQKIVDRDLAAARSAGQNTTALTTASESLSRLAEELADLHGGFDAALAPLRARLRSVENWFDTVMQSFEERYSRGMRTWAMVISLIVVVVSNANFFVIAKEVWNDDVRRAQLVALGEKGELQKQQLPLATSQEARDALGAQIKETEAEIKRLSGLYSSLGFEPLSKASPSKSPGGVFGMLAGWLVMALLLSVGAPFWQDTLESLFGLKNLLRKRGGIQNVEQRSGEGHPRQT